MRDRLRSAQISPRSLSSNRCIFSQSLRQYRDTHTHTRVHAHTHAHTLASIGTAAQLFWNRTHHTLAAHCHFTNSRPSRGSCQTCQPASQPVVINCLLLPTVEGWGTKDPEDPHEITQQYQHISMFCFFFLFALLFRSPEGLVQPVSNVEQ